MSRLIVFAVTVTDPDYWDYHGQDNEVPPMFSTLDKARAYARDLYNEWCDLREIPNDELDEFVIVEPIVID